MSDSYKVENRQKINLLNLSWSNSFGAERNHITHPLQQEVDNNWQDFDLGTYDTIIGPFSQFSGVSKFKGYGYYNNDTDSTLLGSIALVGALEYLNDIRPLVRSVRNALIRGAAADIFIGFKGGYYSWTSKTAEAFLGSMGIEVRAATKVTRTITKLTLTCSKSSYEEFLQSQALPQPTFSHLMVTTEHSGYRVTGGIGSYVKECDNLYGDDVAILILDNNATLDVSKIEANKWLTPQMFLGFDRVDTITFSNFDTYGDIIQEALECIVALYPNIYTVESQEMLLNRTIDAKALSILPQSIKLITTCHGSSFHLAKAKRTVLDAENIHVAYREKYTLEHSDVVILPTDFLRRSYIDSGAQDLSGDYCVKKRLPFDLSRLPRGERLKEYERLLYIGKTSTIKGFDLFLESLLEIYNQDKTILDKIKEVVIMATSVDIVEPYLKVLYDRVRELYNVKIVSLDREVLLQTLAEYSANTLALITYRGDNHPLAVLELMAIGHDFIAADAAGTPELILPNFKEHNLAPPVSTLYANAVLEAVKNPQKRSSKVAELRAQYLVEQGDINTSYNVKSLQALASRPERVKKKDPKKKLKVKVDIIGNHDTEAYRNTEMSVINQTYEYVTLDARKVEKPDLKMRLYAGDVLYPAAIEQMVKMYNTAENVGAVMSDEIVMSYNGDGTRRGFEEFHPYAPELGSVLLQEKYSRRMVALFDGDYLDDSFTDWQKVIAAACEGKRVMVVPRVLIELTDLENYFIGDTVALSSKFAHSFTALPVFDATILYSELERFDQIYWGLKKVGHLHEHFASAEELRRYEEISPKVIRIIGAYNRFTPTYIKKFIRTSGNLTFKSLKKIKNTLKK